MELKRRQSGDGRRGERQTEKIKRIESNLWSDVVGRSAKCFRHFLAIDSLLAHAEIGDFDVSVLIEKNVVQFQVAVNYPATVQEEKSDCDLGCVESKHDRIIIRRNIVILPLFFCFCVIIFMVMSYVNLYINGQQRHTRRLAP